MKLVFVDAKHLSVGQKQRIVELQSECFSHVSRKEIEECFFAKGFGWVFAYDDDDVIIGQAELYSRRTRFEEKTISLGGIGGTCVSIDSRRNGIGKELVKMGLRILREKKSCLPECGREESTGRRTLPRAWFQADDTRNLLRGR